MADRQNEIDVRPVFPSLDIHNHPAPFPLFDLVAGETREFAAPESATDPAGRARRDPASPGARHRPGAAGELLSRPQQVTEVQEEHTLG